MHISMVSHPHTTPAREGVIYVNPCHERPVGLPALLRIFRNYIIPLSRPRVVLAVTRVHVLDTRDLKQGRRRRLRERCLKILFPVTVIILRLLHVVRLGKCECAIQE